MQYNHELIVPNEDLPFKMFIFEGKEAPERCPACDHPQAHFEAYTFFKG